MPRDCPFCLGNITQQILHANEHAFAILDLYPVSKGHHLIITKRHVPDYFSLTPEEKSSIDNLIGVTRASLLSSDNSITGFNIGVNIGASAGQTIFHVHIHIIPRRDGDTPNPRGGVRGVIPTRMGY
ncbi:HIT domain-containing protein [Desulfovibrio aminophilus]|nr:HIT domain-containing protein [Desulfovibrio aminophilus]MCM0756763.1 HIT domain-containing protein [Desulfovibrio aminophilus]